MRSTMSAHYLRLEIEDLLLFSRDSANKTTYWTSIDPWLSDDLYLHENFEKFFNDRAGESVDGLYPTVTIRQIMWDLKMKPLKRERWETCFDRRLI